MKLTGKEGVRLLRWFGSPGKVYVSSHFGMGFYGSGLIKKESQGFCIKYKV